MLTRQIEELLAQKRAEENRLQKDLAAVENHLGDVRRKYDRQLSRLQARREALHVLQRDCEQEEREVNEQHKAFLLKQQAVRHRERKIRRRVAVFSLDSRIVASVIALFESDSTSSESPLHSSPVLHLLARDDSLLLFPTQDDNLSALLSKQHYESGNTTVWSERQRALLAAQRSLQKTTQRIEVLQLELASLQANVKNLTDIGIFKSFSFINLFL